MLLLQNKAEHEEIDGYLPVKKKNRYGAKQHRWLLFSTEALYITLPHNFSVCRLRISLSEIINIKHTSDNKAFSLEIMRTEKSSLILYSNQTLHAVHAIQSLRYMFNSELKEAVIVKTEKELVFINETEDLISKDILFLKIKADYGLPGEQLIQTFKFYMISDKKAKEQITLMATNKTLFILDYKNKLFNYLELDDVISITMICEDNNAVINTEEGDL